ncbi:MAG: hypothetical protein COV67_09325 [Nitrospinae bacterium CG11_big_fil_rev_8_21_14_0_20_56_8]|nr:MAG: hypothetical protein COV67_09325 [Nitrospinae bacterium CG11_big_fil_rev_8_21_14_0_20_56_8]
MSGLKSAIELSMERSGSSGAKKLSEAQKKEIAEIRKEYQARIADKDVTLQTRLNHLGDRTHPEEIHAAAEAMKEEFFREKKALEEEMEKTIETVRNRSEGTSKNCR